jgi:PAS domain S-box-containing protein
MREMSEKKIDWRKRCSELETLLQKERGKVQYYQSLGRLSGKKSLQEISKLSRIVAERKHAEKALRESDERFSLFMDHLPAIVFIKDEKNMPVYANKYMKDILEPIAWKGTTEFDVFQEKVAAKMIADDKKALSDGLLTTVEKVRFRNGIERIYETRKFRIERQGAPPLLGGIVFDVTERESKEQALRQKDKDLEIKATSLEEVNTALRVLLKKREEDRAQIEEKVLCNVKDLISPYLEKLKRTPLDVNQASCVAVLESNLCDIISPFAQRLSSKYLGLTPTEIRVANLVKNGKSAKEIAGFMHLSGRTVERHRQNIRKKLGIAKTKVNLRTYLSFVE